MALLTSKSLKLGSACPDFALPSVDKKQWSLKDFRAAKTLLVAFICNHCPYVRAIEDRLLFLRQSFSKSDLAMVGICSNDAQRYPADGPEELLKRWQEKNYGFPYLLDARQEAAKNFDAVCTPDLFLFDQKRELFYHGELDDNWQDEKGVTREYLKEAIFAAINGEPAPKDQHPSMGCSIKWNA